MVGSIFIHAAGKIGADVFLADLPLIARVVGAALMVIAGMLIDVLAAAAGDLLAGIVGADLVFEAL